MREVRYEEINDLMDQGYGFCNFMGGISSKNGGEILEVDGIFFLFEKDEKYTEEFELIVEEQMKEYDEHLEQMGY